jgi:hypothetical protein
MASPYEREIEELLRSLGPIGPKETGWQRFRRIMGARLTGLAGSIRDIPRTVPAEQLMIAAFLMVIAAYFLRLVPGFSSIVGLLATVGIVMFVLAFGISFQQLFGRSRGNQPRWRGRPIDMRSGQPTMIDRFVFWLRRKMRGH